MSQEVYITKAAKFLPNKPIANDEMELFLGLINGKPSKSRGIVLRNNGIKCRYYAMDKNGNATHTNSQMAALAVKQLFNNNAKEISSIDLLSCGTSSPDQLMPSHGVMVHGWLPETNEIEVVSPSGNCCSGMHALKYAWMSVKLGQAKNAVVTGSERLSRIMRADSFEEEASKLSLLDENPYISFDKEFLRWMLSDGAAAVKLNNAKSESGTSLRIDAIEGFSFAHKTEPCMYQASDKVNGELKGYSDFSQKEIMSKSVFSIKQDVKLLSENIVTLGIPALKKVLENNHVKPTEIDYFIPHLSSEFFRNKIAEQMEAANIMIPKEKWFTNLSEIGNVGSASVYMMLEELLNTGNLKTGEKIFLLVPESARFSYVFALLTVA